MELIAMVPLIFKKLQFQPQNNLLMQFKPFVNFRLKMLTFANMVWWCDNNILTCMEQSLLKQKFKWQNKPFFLMF